MKALHMRRSLLSLAVLAGALLAPLSSQAESNFQSGLGTLTATSRLDFSITIERFLYLRVGTGTLQANNSTIDLVNFAVSGAQVGTGNAVAGSSTVTAQVRGNGGAVTFGNTTPGALSNGAQTIAYTTITAASALLAGSATNLVHPPFVAAGNSATSNLAATNNVVNAGSTWTFSYSNAALMAAGTYGGTVARNARVTYTAAMP